MMRLIFAAALAAVLAGPALADPSQGVFGSTDKAAAQRGLLVYQTVCAACHALGAVHYRDLEALGLSPDQVAGFAAGIKMQDGQPATLDDVFRDPGMGAAAFGGAVPPDLSGIVAQRAGGVAYVDGVLTGYAAAPAGVTLLPAHYYNTMYPGGQIAMPNVLRDHAVTYADGTPATAAQEAADVTAFLDWTADPNLDARHEIGVRAVMFLVFMSGVAIAAKRRVWREVV